MRERDERVYSALTDELFAGKRLQEILDYFGIEVSRDTNDVFDQPTAHLSLFFDNYYIADGRGNVIFGRQPKPQSYDEHRRHRAGVPFASLATIQDLLVEDPPAALPVFDSALDLDAHTNTAPSPTGHSMVRNIHVGDVDLSVFIHPFTADDLTLYVVGAVLRSSLTTEAIRIRLGDAVDAMLAIAILITLLPVLRFWTAGDRSIFRRFALYSVCGSVLGASALSAALLLSVNSKLLDGQALDRQLKLISDEIHDNFYSERHAVERGLKSDLRQMERCADLDIHLSVPGKIERHIICPICPPQDDSSSRRWLTALPLGSVGRDPLTHAATHDTWSHNKLGWPIDQSRNHVFRGWWPTSSFLLTGEGKRAICKQYRRNNISLSLDLSFREYFKDADEEFRLYRIDSVVRGVNQIVGSIKSREERNKGRHVAVAIQKFWSIDGLVLPPYFQYAVVDEEGYTIFHSDEDRNSVANFLNDTGNDPGVRAAMAYEVGATLDAQYDGMPIRAHLRKLPGKENWTLVVFRSHMLVDQVSSFTSSFSIISWLLTMLVTLTLFGISAIIPRPGGQRLLPSAVLTSTDVRTGIAGVILGFVGVLTAYHHSGGLSILVGLLWPALVGFTIFVPAWLRLRRAGKHTLSTSLRSQSSAPVVGIARRSVWIKVCVLFSLVFSSSIVPMLAWQNYFRTELSTGLAAHLEDMADSAVLDKRDDFKQQTKSLTYVRDVDHDRCKGDNRLLGAFLEKGVVGLGLERVADVVKPVRCDGVRSNGSQEDDQDVEWPFGGLSPFLTHSPLSWQAMWYRAGEPSGRARSVRDAVGIAMERPHARWRNSSSSEAWRWIFVFVGAVFVLFMCYSAVRVKFGYARHVVCPALFSLDDVTKESFPRRLLLVRRSEKDVQQLIEELSGRFVVKCFRRGDQSGIVWEDFSSARRHHRGLLASTPDQIAFVVEDFRGATSDEGTYDLASELKRKMYDGAVVICSDVVPHYHMDPGTVDERDATQPAWEANWRELIGHFEVRVLCGASKRGLKLNGPSKVVCEVLGPELEANADFEDLIKGIGRRLAEAQGLPESRLRERALREFHGAAQSRFKTIWAVSSFDERAQLYALAHGGSPNRERPAAISSLVSRGLITDTDPIELCSEAFGQFIVDDLDDSLDDWRRKGHRDWWRVTWLPLVLFAGLGLLFFINSNPQAIGVIAAIGAALIGVVPVVTSLLRVGQVVQPTVPSNSE